MLRGFATNGYKKRHISSFFRKICTLSGFPSTEYNFSEFLLKIYVY